MHSVVTMMAKQAVQRQHLNNAPYTEQAVVFLAVCVHKLTSADMRGRPFSLLVFVLYAATQTTSHDSHV